MIPSVPHQVPPSEGTKLSMKQQISSFISSATAAAIYRVCRNAFPRIERASRQFDSHFIVSFLLCKEEKALDAKENKYLLLTNQINTWYICWSNMFFIISGLKSKKK